PRSHGRRHNREPSARSPAASFYRDMAGQNTYARRGGSMLLVIFLIAAGVLWASVFGYVGVLLALTLGAQHRRRAPRLTTLPHVAVVIPVRDEETFIAAKLDDVSRADYPADRLTTVVVDGGSTDRTVAIVEAARAAGAAVE